MNKNSLKETYVSHKIGNLQMNVYPTHNYIPYHWHDEWEFLYVTRGECEYVINGNSISVKKGQAILIHSGELHTVHAGTTGQFFAVVFHPYLIFGTEFKEFFSKKISYNRIYNEDQPGEAEVISLLKEVHSAFCKRYFGFELTLKATLIKILAVIYENHLYTVKEPKKIYGIDAFAEIVEYVHENFSEKILLDDLEKELNFSKSYIIRLFKKNTGKTFSTYLNSYRIYKAVEMLEEKDKSILEISESCGFENVAYFIKIFKKNMGITPHKYRMNLKKGVCYFPSLQTELWQKDFLLPQLLFLYEIYFTSNPFSFSIGFADAKSFHVNTFADVTVSLTGTEISISLLFFIGALAVPTNRFPLYSAKTAVPVTGLSVIAVTAAVPFFTLKLSTGENSKKSKFCA